MDTVEIAADTDISLEEIRSHLALRWELLKSPADRLAIQEHDTRVYIYYGKLESGETERRALFLDYHSTSLVKRVLEVIGDDPLVLIDNGFGTVLPGDQFVKRLKSEPEWDWHRDLLKPHSPDRDL